MSGSTTKTNSVWKGLNIDVWKQNGQKLEMHMKRMNCEGWQMVFRMP